MCTNTCAQPEGHFQRFGGLLRNHPDQIQTMSNHQVRKRTAEKFLQTLRALRLKCSNFQENCKMQFFADRFRKWENSLGTNIEHMPSRCMADGAEDLHSLLFSAHRPARLLVHVRCPRNFSPRLPPKSYDVLREPQGQKSPKK